MPDLSNFQLGIWGNLLLAFPFIVFLPGFMAVRTLIYIREETHFSERLFIQILISTVISSVAGFILAFLGKFNIYNLVFCGIGASATFLVLARFKFRFDHKKRPGPGSNDFILLFILLAGFFLYERPSEYILGGWDPGIYMNAGINLSKTGSIYAEDPMWPEMTPRERQLFTSKFPPDRFDGFNIIDKSTGRSLPYFYHMYPVWIGIFHQLFGDVGSLFVNSFFALLSILAAYSLYTVIFQKKGALFFAALLAFNTIQIWFARFQCSELLAQFFLLSALYCLFKYISGDKGFELIAAGSLLAAFLTRLPEFFILIPVLLLMPVLRPESSFKESLRFYLPVLAVGFIALWYYFSAALIPTLHITKAFSKIANPLRYVLSYAAAGFSIYLVILYALSKKLTVIGSINDFLKKNSFRTSFAFFFICLFLWAYFYRPQYFSDQDAMNVPLFVQALSPLIILAAIAGFLLIIRGKKDNAIYLAICCFLFFAVLFLWHKRVNSSYFWALRRYIPMVLPGILFFAAYLFDYFWEKKKIFYRILSGTVLAGVLALPLYSFKPLLFHRDLHGALNFSKAVTEELDKADIVICDGDWIGLPLRFIYGFNVLEIVYPTIEKCSEIEKTLLSWIAQHRSIYYISDGPAIYSGNLNFELISIKNWISSSLERSYNELPDSIEKFKQTARTYQIGSLAPYDYPSKKSKIPYRVDLGKNCFGLVSGFYEPYSYSLPAPGSLTWRWTAPKAYIEFINPVPAAGAITIRARSQRPGKTAPATVNISINGDLTYTQMLQNQEEFQTIHFSQPPSPEKEPVRSLTIDSNTWNPAKSGYSKDDRDLGIEIDSIEFDTKVIDIGNENFSEVKLSNFHTSESDITIKQECRWTAREAEIVLPWFGNDESNTITLKASGFRPADIDRAKIRFFIDGEPIGSPTLENDMGYYTFVVPPNSLKTSQGNRVVLKIVTENPWDPSQYGLEGYPEELGILVDWIEIN